MATFTLRPADRQEFDSLLGGIVQQFPDARVEAAHNDTWASYRVDVRRPVGRSADRLAARQPRQLPAHLTRSLLADPDDPGDPGDLVARQQAGLARAVERDQLQRPGRHPA